MARTCRESLSAGRAPAGTVLRVMALLALAIGAWVYLVARPPGTTMLLPPHWHLGGHLQGLAGALPWAASGWLPSLLHPWAFGLMSAACLPRGRSQPAACLAWGAVNVVFELGQHPALAAPLAQALHHLAWPGADALSRYFLQGSFDTADLLAVAAGTLAACSCVAIVSRARERPHA